MENIAETSLIQINFSDQDLKRVEWLKEMTGETNGSRILVTALELAELVVKNLKSGNQIAIEHPDHQKEYIRIQGT